MRERCREEGVWQVSWKDENTIRRNRAFSFLRKQRRSRVGRGLENPLTDALDPEQSDDPLAPLEFFDDFDDVHMVGRLVGRLVMAGRLVIVDFLVLVGIPVQVGFPVVMIFDGSAVCPSCIGFPVVGIFVGIAVSVAEDSAMDRRTLIMIITVVCW